MKKLVLSIFLSSIFLLSGCVTTKIKGHTDPDLIAFKAHSIAVIVPGNSNFTDVLESYLIDELNDAGANAVYFQSIIPPTRTFTENETIDRLESSGIEAVLIITPFDEKRSSRYAGTVVNASSSTTGYGSLYGNRFNYSSRTSGGGLATPITFVSRNMSLTASLRPVREDIVAWVANIHSEAGGHLYMSDESSASQIASDLIDQLESSGHLSKEKRKVTFSKQSTGNKAIDADSSISVSTNDAFEEGKSLYFEGQRQAKIPDFSKAHKSYKKAIDVLRPLAESGDVDAQNLIAAVYAKIGKQDVAFEWRMKAAEEGFTPSQAAIGRHYYSGLGVEKDLRKAYEYFQKAAEGNHPYAKTMVPIVKKELGL